MRTVANGGITQSQDALRDASGWSVVYVARLDVDGTTHRFATRALTLDGNAYWPILLSPGNVARVLGEGRKTLGATDDTWLIFANHRATGETRGLVETLHHVYRLEAREARVGVLFESPGATESDICWLAVYQVEGVSVADDPPRVTVHCVDASQGVGEREIGRLIDKTHFPAAAHSAYGRMLPIVFGHATDCPLLPVDIGAATTLNGSLSAEGGVVAVRSVSGFPSSGEVWIGDEAVRYTARSVTGKTLGTLSSPVTRGWRTDPDDPATATIAREHADGAEVWLKKDSLNSPDRYLFAVADHPCVSVSDVRLDGRSLSEGSGVEEYERRLLSDPFGDGRYVEAVAFKRPPTYRSVSAFATRLRVEQSAPGERSEYEWRRGAGDNLGVVLDPADPDYGRYYADLVIDVSNPRDAAILQDARNRLRIRLPSDLSDGRLGDLVKAWIKCEYFTLNEETHGVAIRAAHTSGGVERWILDGAPLAPAPAAEHQLTGASRHRHDVDRKEGFVGVAPSTGLAAIDGSARASSMAVQTVAITHHIDRYVQSQGLADRWAVFDGDSVVSDGAFALEIGTDAWIPPGGGPGLEDHRIFITRLWLEFEVRQAERRSGFDSLVADVEGIARSGSLMTNPADIVARSLLTTDAANGVPDFGCLGLDTSALDPALLDMARRRLDGENPTGQSPMERYRFNRRIGKPLSTRRLLQEATRDCRMRLFREGDRYRFHVVDLDTREPVKTLDETNVIAVRVKGHAALGSLFNEVALGYNEEYDRRRDESTSYRAHVTACNEDSVAMPWGVRPCHFTARWLGDQFESDGAPDDAAALDNARFWADALGSSRERVALRATLECADLERHDVVLIDLPRQGLSQVVGRVMSIGQATLSQLSLEVEVFDTSTRCADIGGDAFNHVAVSAGARTMRLRQGALTTLALSDEWLHTPALTQDHREISAHALGPVVLASGAVGEASTATFTTYDAAAPGDDKWLEWMRVDRDADGSAIARIHENITIRTERDLGAETPRSVCVYGDPVAGDVTFTLGGAVVAMLRVTPGAGLVGATLDLAGTLRIKDF